MNNFLQPVFDLLGDAVAAYGFVRDVSLECGRRCWRRCPDQANDSFIDGRLAASVVGQLEANQNLANLWNLSAFSFALLAAFFPGQLNLVADILQSDTITDPDGRFTFRRVYDLGPFSLIPP